MSEANPSSHPLVQWLITEARRIAEPPAFLAALAEQLRAHGADVVRATTGVPILHPQVHSFSGLWEVGKGASERVYHLNPASFAVYENSPTRIVYEGGGPVRCDPTAPPREGEFGILADLRSAGMTDYIALNIPFSDGSSKMMSLATRRPGGFTDGELALFDLIRPAVAVNLEVQALRRTARTLLDTYVGRQAGGRVLNGAIHRGMGETIRAVIWLCDLRGFTVRSEALPRDALIAMLNGYFGAMCDAVDAHGGEVLKFIGDAMLAIFPIAADDAGSACRQALAAAEAAEAAIAAINLQRQAGGEAELDYGLALHIGDVLYGNIGGRNRLDFTVIGPAVNLAARIEGLCHETGRRPLMSEEFVTASGVPAAALGDFALKGVAARRSIFAFAAPPPP
jgi:adenylate cyclase